MYYDLCWVEPVTLAQVLKIWPLFVEEPDWDDPAKFISGLNTVPQDLVSQTGDNIILIYYVR